MMEGIIMEKRMTVSRDGKPCYDIVLKRIFPLSPEK